MTETSLAVLALVVGNSRLHWGLVTPIRVIATWDTDYWDDVAIARLQRQPKPKRLSELLKIFLRNSEISSQISSKIPLRIIQDCINSHLWLASVVKAQTQQWQHLLPCHLLTLQDISLHNLYRTMGVDRALALAGAERQYGLPALVVDGGTALTFSGVNGSSHFVGGAIAPGFRLQGRALALHTAALPHLSAFPENLGDRWTTETSDAIQHGIVYMMLAGIEDFLRDWWRQFPTSVVVFTGGDGKFFYDQICQRLHKRTNPDSAAPDLRLYYSENLVFEGICAQIGGDP